jgi:DNA-binding response OmpR family regulator
MNEMKILIVEDESIVAMEIESFVTHLGYHVVDICSNSKDSILVAQEEEIDIILMDICLKGEVDGVETAEMIKTIYPNIQVIFLTAHMDDYNVDRAIALNPVSYLSKPFNQEELRVSLKIATMKKNDTPMQRRDASTHLFLDDEFCYDTTHHLLYCCNELIHLTKKESDLLKLLIDNKNKIMSAFAIEQVLWTKKVPHPNTLRTLIKRLREKLKHKFLETIPAQGYKLLIPSPHTGSDR